MARESKARREKSVAFDQAGSAAGVVAAESSPPGNSRQPDKSDGSGNLKLNQIRSRLESAVGQLVLLMMQAPHYRHHSIADLGDILLEPLLRDRVAIAHARPTQDTQASSGAVGAAIWASVDEAADAKIREQIKAGAFPVRLSRDEWSSGDRIWLLDIIAGNRKSASAVLMNFRAIAGGKPVQLHPLVARSVDPDILEKAKVKT